MGPPEGMNGPHGGPPGPPPQMGQQYHPGHQQHHYGGYMNDIPPQHQQHMGYDQRQYDQRQYDQRGPYEQQYHQYPQYPGHMGHMGHREGDPYSFVDEYSGPPPRPVDEILGGQPKRRGRKPKHIKLMENGSLSFSGDPLAIAAAQAAHEAKKRKWKQLGPDGKPIPHQVKPRKKVDRFDGIPEDEVSKRTLPDHLGPGLDIVIISKFPFQIGINPGLFAAYKGHHYAGPGNHFWKCLFLSGLIPEPLTSDDDFRLLEHGIGFTNIVSRTTRGSSDLTRKEIKEGGQILLTKLQQFQPRIAVFNGKGIYEIFSGKKEFTFGRQPERIEGTRTHVWVMPSSSARCAQLPRALDKVPFYTALRKFKDFLKGTIDELKEEEFTFQVKAKHYKHYKQNLENDPIKQELIKDEMLMIKQEMGTYEQQEGGCPQMNNDFSDVLGEKREPGYGGEPEMGLGGEKSMSLADKNIGLGGGEKNMGLCGEKPMGLMPERGLMQKEG
ncbi:unnamed protein product [Meganyctiphanes norvegica]|uniref:G/T mismatch-specific thymine DNA glycosylase n=1 Tax=Meganyctiphanes norvegica TaxID=48144 RepID=A0AAV2RKV7_MEGNR